MRRRDFVIVLLGSTLLATREGRTQQQRLLGFLSAGSADAYAPFIAAFRSALSDAGYTEGRNLAIEFRWAEGHYDRLSELTADLVRSQVDVIVASGGDIVIGAVKAATPTPRVSPSRAREEIRESRGMPCLLLNTERVLGGKPPKNRGFAGILRGQKCLKRRFSRRSPVGEWSRGARSMPRVFGRGSRSQPAALVSDRDPAHLFLFKLPPFC